MIEKIINKIQKNFLNFKKCIFNENEIEYIVSLSIPLIIENDEHKNIVRLFYLISNIESNLPEPFIEYAKMILSFPNMYFIDPNIAEYEIFGIKISDLKRNLISINNKTLSFEQNNVYLCFRDFQYIFLKASTGAGKTFLTSNFLIERYNNSSDKNKKFIMIVPTEILEQQIISNLENSYPSLKNNEIIGNNPDDNKILILTQEKLISHINVKNIEIEIDTLIIDECHALFNNEDFRGLFLKHIINQYFEHKRDINKVILISPFSLNDDKENELCNLFKTNDFLKIEINNRNINNKFLLNQFEEIKDNSKKIDNVIINNYNNVCCVYANKINNTKSLVKKYFKNNEYIKNIKNANNKQIEQNELKKILTTFDDKKYEKYEKYLNFKYIKSGICYLSSNIPDEIKMLIMDLVKKRYIRLVVATSLIIEGVDLPFDITILNNNKISNKVLDNNSIINFFGRAGRINKYKRAFGAGFSYIKINKDNFNWWTKNKQEIYEKLNKNKNFYNEFNGDSENKNFIINSYEKFDLTHNKIYLYDPRINPDTTNLMIKFANNENYMYLLENLLNFNSLRFEKIIPSTYIKNGIYAYAFLFFYKYYEYYEYLNYYPNDLDISINYEDDFQNILNNLYDKIKNSGNHDCIPSNLNFYLNSNLDIEVALQKYIKWIYKKFKDRDEETISKWIEKFVYNIKNLGKFHLLNFLNHFWMLIENPQYTNIHVIIKYSIYNNEFYLFLKENNFLEYINKEVINNNKIKNEWEKVNINANNIIEIWKHINKNDKLLNILNQNENFLTKFQEYINKLI